MYTPSSAYPPEARGVVDLRSDTVTRPTAEMYEAMANAPVGDDVLGDEPTVMRLEAMSAEITGMEAAVFVPSGTMANQIALATHCRPGDAILLEEEAHIVYYEVGASAAIAGVVTWTLPSVRGVMEPERVASRILKRSLHTPGTALLCVENTHNRAGGAIVPVETMRQYRKLAERHAMRIHLDGARVFNAAVALGVPVSDITTQADSVSFCLSKGLRSPVGSLLCGTRDFIEEARVWRKRLGGGMRQSGILAACGIVSLTRMVERLADDHARAKRAAESLAGIEGLTVDADLVQTNMVLVTTRRPAGEWVADLAREDVWCFDVGPNRLRLVFHADVDEDMTGRAIAAFERIAARDLARAGR